MSGGGFETPLRSSLDFAAITVGVTGTATTCGTGRDASGTFGFSSAGTGAAEAGAAGFDLSSLGASGLCSCFGTSGCTGLATVAGPLVATSNFFFGAPVVGNASSGLVAIAALIKSIHIGNAALAPVSFSPSDSRSSNPIHVPHVIDGENPMNQASV
jgi:hypothetical protein